ncbi:MAG: diguanylate cyclase [Planctomycetota bacterium]|nr:diguanylate cyclase [Planctomycetota bacterium]
MLKQALIILLIILIPLLTLIFATIYHFSPSYLNHTFMGGFPALLTAFSSLCAIYCICLVVLFFVVNQSNKSLWIKNVSHQKSQEDIIRQNKILSSRVDLLSATREISLIITHEVDFRTILTKSLEIISYFITSSLTTKISDEKESITIFLKDEISGRLTPQAQRKSIEVIFEDELTSTMVDWRNVNESLEHSRLFFSADGEVMDFTIPLVADRETIGVLKVKTLLDKQEKEEVIKHLQDNLLELARVLALAVKTPLLYNRAITDGLTALYTKRHLFTELPLYIEISKRHGIPLSVVMFDIDHFKNINDTYGHLTGDMVLKDISSILRETLRATSTAYRYGGEEITIILPHTSKEQALAFAERLRKRVANHSFLTERGEKIKASISLGVAEYQPAMADFKELLSQVDMGLYRAKQQGRNQTVTV